MSDRSQKIQLSVIKQIELLASKRADVISLAQGIPSFDTPVGIKRRAERALEQGVAAKYSLSPGLLELRELIEINLAHDNMFYDWETEIIVTAGSIEGITATLLALTDPGDEVIIPDPTYTSYREAIRLSGCEPIAAPLNEGEGWSFDPVAIERAITDKTKVIFYCNPNNPTGTIYSREQLIAIAELAERHDLYVMADEVYKDFTFDGTEYFSPAMLKRFRKRFIRLFSFSKAFAMTGWRVGYVAADHALTAEIIKVHDCLVTCAPVISQYAAMGALEMGRDWIREFNEEYKLRRDIVCNHLDALSEHLSYVKPRGAYFVFPRLKRCGNSFETAVDILDSVGLALVPGSAFGAQGEHHLRISFGRSISDIEEGMARLRRYFEKV